MARQRPLVPQADHARFENTGARSVRNWRARMRARLLNVRAGNVVMEPRRILKLKPGHVMAVLIVIVFGYLFCRMIWNGNNLREFCNTVKPGMTREGLQATVQAKGLRETFYPDDPKSDTANIRVPAAYPPNTCYVVFEGDLVKSAGFVPYR